MEIYESFLRLLARRSGSAISYQEIIAYSSIYGIEDVYTLSETVDALDAAYRRYQTARGEGKAEVKNFDGDRPLHTN